MDSTSTHRLAGRVIIAGYEGESVPGDLKSALEDGALGGLVFFSRNFEGPEHLAEVIGSLPRDESTPPPLLSIDHEGGRVQRLRAPLTRIPTARALGLARDPGLIEDLGRLVGLELRAVGLNLDFAPVLDVDTRPDSPVIGDRAFAGDPETVIRCGLAFARGLRAGGVHPCAKHFPGHGDAELDSHVDVPTVDHHLERLEKVELEPFAAWARTGLGPVMTAHVRYPALDPDRTATCSPAVIELLRKRLHFQGAILSDDLEMGAVAFEGGAPQAAVAAISAGVDGLLVCRSEEIRAFVIEELARRAEDTPSFAARLERAAGRLAALAPLPGRFPGSGWIGSRDHLARKDEVGRRMEKLI